jgi:TIR domain
MARNRVFISYSHRDREWLDRLVEHVAVLERWDLIRTWSDTRIAPGMTWKREIESALRESGVAVLLVSPAFLASEYVWEHEMPRIYEHAKVGMTVLPLLIRPCAWRIDRELASIQARPNDGRALSLLPNAEIDQNMALFAYELAALIGRLAPATADEERFIAQRNLDTPRDQAIIRDGSPGADVYEANALQRVLRDLPASWTGMYRGEDAMRLTVREVHGDTFDGHIDYLDEQTVTEVEGRWAASDKRAQSPRKSRRASSPAIDITFRETRYRQKGTKTVDLEGEYRATVDGDLLRGGWFKGTQLVGEFELVSDSSG